MSSNPTDPPAPKTTFFDVMRFLVRRVGGHSDGETQRLLLTLDGAEQGFGSLEDYQDHQAKVAATEAAANRTPQQTAAAAAGLTDADLEAELAARQAARPPQLTEAELATASQASAPSIPPSGQVAQLTDAELEAELAKRKGGAAPA